MDIIGEKLITTLDGLEKIAKELGREYIYEDCIRNLQRVGFYEGGFVHQGIIYRINISGPKDIRKMLK